MPTVTSARILGTALRLFAKEGFFDTSVDDIARTAGVAKGTIYLYFKDKPSIFVAAIDEHFREAMVFLGRVEGRRISARQKLEAVVQNLLQHTKRFGSSFPSLGFENVDAAGRALKDLRRIAGAHVRDVTRLIARIIEQGIGRGEFRRVDPEVAAIHFLSVVRTTVVASAIFRRRPIDSKAAFDIFLKGLEKRR